jgi:hypothetical protein
MHVYFQSSDQRCGRVPRGFLDFKAVGGYVLVPPSATPSGKYRLLEAGSVGSTLDFDRVREVLAPARFKTVARGRASRGGLEAFVTNLSVGERNRGLFWAACQALRNGEGDLSGLLAAGLQTGLPEREVRTVLRSARRAAGAS